MNYGVRRVNHTADCAQYHLFDHRAMLQLVADYGSPWVPAHQMRLARPDGKSVASLTLPKPLFARLRRPTANLASYALVMENAVYAVINRLQPSAANQSRTPYYVIEVESQKWLVLALAEQAGCFALYSTVPPNLAFTPLHQVALPAAVGQIAAATPSPYHFHITLEPGRLRHIPHILLSLIFLIDNPQQG